MSAEKTLIVVESPKKAKTLATFLNQSKGKGQYEILASFGHVRDLIPKTGAIDVDNDFSMKYEVLSAQKNTLMKSSKLRRKQIKFYWHPILIVREKPSLGTSKKF